MSPISSLQADAEPACSLPAVPDSFGQGTKPWWCHPFSWRAIVLHQRSGGATVLRRASMWVSVLFRLALSAFNIMRFSFGSGLAIFIAGIVLAVLNLYFTTICLAFLGRAEGTRRVLKINRVSCWRHPEAYPKSNSK